MENQQSDSFRYERKYVLSPVDLPSLLYQINYHGFNEIYSQRQINNLYFDSHDFSCLKDNINGLSNRKKYRIRWYGDSFRKAKMRFEVKIKNEYLNTKDTTRLDEYQIKGYNDIRKTSVELVNNMESKNLKLFDIIKNYDLKLFNTYKRKYFLSPNEDLRITIDTSLEYYSPITFNIFKEKDIIVEFKYKKDHNFNNPFKKLNLNKYSKYVKGLLSTSFYNPLY